MNNKQLQDLQTIKSYVKNQETNGFTVKQVIEEAKITRHFFNTLVESNYIIPTGIHVAAVGAPQLFKLNDIFLEEKGTQYSLNKQEIKILLEDKKNAILNLQPKLAEISNQRKQLKMLLKEKEASNNEG
jgi:hypothetical protein